MGSARQASTERSFNPGSLAADGLLFGALYLLFAGTFSIEEAVVAVLGGGLTAVGRSIGLRHGRPFAGGVRDGMRLAPRVLRSILLDSISMGGAFLRLLAGRSPDSRFVEVPLDPGGGDPASRTRRGLVVGAVSLAPNQYVIGLDYANRRLLVHQFSPAPTPKDPQWPV